MAARSSVPRSSTRLRTPRTQIASVSTGHAIGRASSHRLCQDRTQCPRKATSRIAYVRRPDDA
eukprot:470896-Rhodomonas_salina.2